MIRWLTRRHPRYLRSLVYMLQASEYNIADFFKWHERTQDFRAVEKRKSLDFTLKAIALLVLCWVVFGGVVVGATLALIFLSSPWSYIVFVVLLFEMPLIVLVSLVVALLVLRGVQFPIEKILIRRATNALAAHRGVKIAIAGSFGKTSMREILRTILAEGKKVAAPGGSYNTPLGIVQFVKTLKGDEDVLVFELGEYYPGDVRKLCEMVRPTLGIITGINEAHLEKFGSIENTARTIFELAEHLDGAPVYINAENTEARRHARKGDFLYSREGLCDWRITHARAGLEGTSFILSRGDERVNAHSKLLGLHMIGPIATAADIAYKLGLSKEAIERGVARTKPFAHRLEIRTEGGVTILDDSYNGNPDGVAAVIEFIKNVPGRRWYITPGLVEMGSDTKNVHEKIGEQLAKAGIEKIVLIRNSVTHFIEQGLNDAGYKGEITWFPDGPSAYAAIPHLTLPGDVVVFQNDWPDQYA